MRGLLAGLALLPACAGAALSLAQVRNLRASEPVAGLRSLGTDTSQVAAFLRAELTLRAGDAKGARTLARTFLAERPGSDLVFRARLLEGWASLRIGDVPEGLDLLSGVAAGTDSVASLQARASLAEWVSAGRIPAPQLLRLASLVAPGGDTLHRSILDAFARRPGASPQGPVVVVLPQTGDFGAIGRRVTAGLRIALAKDAAEIVVLDEPSDPVAVAKLLRGVLQVSRPRAIVGPLLSAAATVAVQEVARFSPETPVVLPAATSPGIAGLSPNAAQINITTQAQGRAAARLARTCSKADVAWLLHPRGEYGDAVAEGFRREFERLGGRIAWEQSWPGGRTDFRAQLEALRRSAAEGSRAKVGDSGRPTPLVFAPAENASEAAALGSQARALAMSPVWIGASGWHSRQFLTESAGRLDGALLVTDRIPDTRRPAWKTLVAGWKDKEGPDPIAALGYDAGLVVSLGRLPLAPEVLAGAAGDISLDPQERFNVLAPRLKVAKGAFAETGCPGR